jgi:hypothetical protein
MDVVGEPGLAQFTEATQQSFSAARHSTACSWNVLAGSPKRAGAKPPGSASWKCGWKTICAPWRAAQARSRHAEPGGGTRLPMVREPGT